MDLSLKDTQKKLPESCGEVINYKTIIINFKKHIAMHHPIINLNLLVSNDFKRKTSE